MSVPVVGPLSVTPLYTASGDRLVWWDGVEWMELEVTGSGPPPSGSAGGAPVTGGGGAGIAGGGGAPVVGGGTGAAAAGTAAPVTGGGDAPLVGGGGVGVSGMQEAALMARIAELEARLVALEGRG